MLSRTIDVDGLKVFCREGGVPGRGTSTSRSTASQLSRAGYGHVLVIFEVFPNKENSDDYLDNAEMLRPELEHGKVIAIAAIAPNGEIGRDSVADANGT